MNGFLLILAAIVVIVVLAAAWWYTQQRRRAELRDHFGPEYDRAVRERGSASAAEADLAQRSERVRALDIQPLGADDRNRFSGEWRQVQARFVDDPAAAVDEADRLVGQVMQRRGYPMADFEQRAADVSVDHPAVVDNYRSAHEIAQHAHAGRATTEDLRKAMVHYRSLFEDLLGDGAGAPDEAAPTARTDSPRAGVSR